MNNWKLSKFFNKENEPEKNPQQFILVILNQPLLIDGLFKRLWGNAKYVLCADGGANRLYDKFKGTDLHGKFIPKIIRGDLDSLRDDVRDFFDKNGVLIEEDKDQNSTDFKKLALGATGGRFDQAMSHINYLHQLKNQHQIYLLSNENIIFLLDKGKHQLFCDKNIEGPTCGLLPIGVEAAVITTTGLKWNLENTSTSFGKLVSTSNHLEDDIITIETDSPIVWTVELNHQSF
ncbi:5363_t:CDS:2 [Entrophospora sp. SA101]|nr:2342_t:CDS:2 [Entrophospora sp. SA101]CAJ0641184.1 5363_t:CDS:2 [Entrophospora sp. SA101]CAJ0833318.1 2495_t:CDS:2 [Entrophospora sp. SA101]CAJ0842137.1 17985_t:CDS:2 [Entrophospora sp. SA101]